MDDARETCSRRARTVRAGVADARFIIIMI